MVGVIFKSWFFMNASTSAILGAMENACKVSYLPDAFLFTSEAVR